MCYNIKSLMRAMNNDYDRGEEGPRYTMSSFNTDLRKMVGADIDIADESVLEPELKLLLLADGKQLLAEFTDLIGTDKYRISNVREIIEEVELGSKDLSVTYVQWMPLSKSNTFIIPKSFVILVCEPHEAVSENYLGATDG
jgi:hypothetical protein